MGSREAEQTGASENYPNLELRPLQHLLINNHDLSTKILPGAALYAQGTVRKDPL